ncbi:aldo/keto reductase [Mesorhizobium sp. LMG 17147]|uniref:aldo/keto reductase n=1 Tax=Mesorhizobium sp. LMG 17147 TaxID=2963091 RepID=UPI0020C9426D|nr:aldo/keto reductase [Mesorhizobium sp. LMG 17147]MCP9232588.1 aldo/keto reductase [Mesorhizobium sp. LMG 17147]
MQMMELWDGRSVPRIGIGTWAAGGPARWRDTATIYGEVDDIRSQAALAMAYDIGARVFDTAAAYGAGNAELILGRALKGKDEAVIVTKVGYFGDPETRKIAPEDASAAAIRTSIDNSRQRLQRDCIDVALLHINEYPIERAGEVFDTLGLLRQEGKIGGFGWSTDHRERLAAYAPREGFVAVENDFNVFTPANGLMAVAARENLVSFSRLPLAMGLLTGKYTPAMRLPTNDVRGGNAEWMVFFRDGAANPHYLSRLSAIRDLLTSGGRTLAQGALGWILAKSAIALPVPGFTRPEQVEDNLGALEKGPLPAAVMAEIDAVLKIAETA